MAVQLHTNSQTENMKQPKLMPTSNRAVKLVCAAIVSLVILPSAANGKLTESGNTEISSLRGKQILFVEREQYPKDHHNTETLFQKGEINEEKFTPGSAIRMFDINNKTIRTLIESDEGVLRDPAISYDAERIIFSWRKNRADDYHIYEMGVDGKSLRQLTFGEGISDIDPCYLPDGNIVFSSTRQPKYCMCNRHIMANLYRMDRNGKQMTQFGFSTLFEGHASVMNDGRILYDRWEYVDRNFGDAQSLWMVNPDGTKHSVYFGNNTSSPGGVIDACQFPNSDLVACIFGSCHDRPWGALAIIDRRRGVDGAEPVVRIFPANSRSLINKGNYDTFKLIDNLYEDPHPISPTELLVSRTISFKRVKNDVSECRMGIYHISATGDETLILGGNKSLFDPVLVEPRQKPGIIPSTVNTGNRMGVFYVQNVYIGTHLDGVRQGDVKYLRVVESPEKRTWTLGGWEGQGQQAPAMNWHGFENKRILGEVPVEADGSAHFSVPAGRFVYFQLLDKDKKMIQTMRSGTTLMPGEVNGCIGCHEDRLTVPKPMASTPMALRKKPVILAGNKKSEPAKFSYLQKIQPILDRKCVSCHDFDPSDRKKLVLARDKNMFFNASYINLYVSKQVKLIGGGPAQILQPYTWGSRVSNLSRIIDGVHHGVKLSRKERELFYAWMDINGVYYPVYESSFDNTLSGRSPLTNEEIEQLKQLTGVNFSALNGHFRILPAMLSFDRPEMSPCLDSVRNDKVKYYQALSIIKRGGKRLKEFPRGDIESNLKPCKRNIAQLRAYNQLMKSRNNNH